MRPVVLAVFGALFAAVVSGCASATHTACDHLGIVHPPEFHPAGCDADWDIALGGRCGKGGCGGKGVPFSGCAHLGELLTCGSGCSEIYWGPWISDPPAPCDPCDDCGNWIGPRPCGPARWERVAMGASNLFGARMAVYEAGGCVGCGEGKGKVGGKGFVADFFASEPDHMDMPVFDGPRVAPPAPPAEEPPAEREPPASRIRSAGMRIPSLLPVSVRSARMRSGDGR